MQFLSKWCIHVSRREKDTHKNIHSNIAFKCKENQEAATDKIWLIYLSHLQTYKWWDTTATVFFQRGCSICYVTVSGASWSLPIHCPVSAPSHNSCCRATSASAASCEALMFAPHIFFMIRHRWKRMLHSGSIWSHFLWCSTTTTTSHLLLKLHARLPSDSGSGGGIVMINIVFAQLSQQGHQQPSVGSGGEKTPNIHLDLNIPLFLCT